MIPVVAIFALFAAAGFDAVAIHPSRPETHTETRRYPGGRFVATGVTLKALIQRAYDVQDFRVIGGPQWLASERFDITATAGRELSGQELNAMLQQMLADRFRLRIRHETRELTTYSLVADKNGPTLHVNRSGKGPFWSRGAGSLTGEKIDMTMFAEDMLEAVLGRVVTDHTGLKGYFDVKLTWAPDPTEQGAPPEITGPSIFTAIREQLGLRLDSAKAPVEVLIVDAAEKPTAN